MYIYICMTREKEKRHREFIRPLSPPSFPYSAYLPLIILVSCTRRNYQRKIISKFDAKLPPRLCAWFQKSFYTELLWTWFCQKVVVFFCPKRLINELVLLRWKIRMEDWVPGTDAHNQTYTAVCGVGSIFHS